MPRFDLRQLSYRDFEELTRDLLQVEWGHALEAFRRGPDQGIDLRHLSTAQGATIVQCKHYAGSGYTALLGHLRAELDKVRGLKPARYVLVTSVELSAKNKDAILELFHPFIRSAGDVIGANDIEGLLQRHPSVVRANFKLWLTSTEVLERVLHNAERCQTEFTVERIIRKLPIFVQNAAFSRAQDILSTTNVLVVSGVPGIGKTTLAEMLLYAHLEQGYEPVVIQNDVREGKSVFAGQRRQIFYFDDFLGQTFLGESRFPGGMNNDLSLVEFVEMIRATGKSRFILTTREHLLQSASAVSERLRHSALLDHRCLLELADYSKGQRARILYNHLYFSDLPRDYKEQVLRDNFFIQVIGHRNFNPRLIEWLSSTARLRNVPSSEYQAHVRRLLANPQEIWSHAFNQQISQAARNVLLCLYSLGGWCMLSQFEELWSAFTVYTATKYRRTIHPKDCQNALKELDNAFVTYSGGRIMFLNPSVRELVGREIADWPDSAIDLIATAGRFRQIVTMVDLAQQSGHSDIRNALSRELPRLIESTTSLLHTPHLHWSKDEAGKEVGIFIDMIFEDRVARIGEMAHLFKSSALQSLFEDEVRALIASCRRGKFSLSDLASLINAFDRRPVLKCGNGTALQRELLNAILADERPWWAAQLNTVIGLSKEVAIWSDSDAARLDAALYHYQDVGLDAEYETCSDADDYERLREALETLGNHLSVPVTYYIERIEEHLAELGPTSDESKDWGAWRRGEMGAGREGDTEDAIRDVFGTLLD